jgi:hypothetical protein
MRVALAAGLAGLLIAACGGGAQPTVDAARTLTQAATAMSKLKTVQATLKFTKGAITFQGFTLAGARTSVRLPGDSDTTYTVKQQDLSISLEVVISGGRVFVHLPFSNFQELTGADAAAIPDLAKLFDPAAGLPAVIPLGQNPKYVRTEKIDGVDCNEVDATYTAVQVHGMLSQLDSTGEIHAQVWAGASDHLIRKAVLDGTFGDGGEEAAVEVDISHFDAAVSITSPTP